MSTPKCCVSCIFLQELKALFICRVVLRIHGGLNGPGDRLASEHLSKRSSQLNACSRAGRDASVIIGFFRDVDEKENGISLGKVDSR